MIDDPERLITLRFATHCRFCHRARNAGEQAWWAAGLGVRCWDGDTGEAVCVDADWEGDPDPMNAGA